MRCRGPARGSPRYVPGWPSAIMEGTGAQRAPGELRREGCCMVILNDSLRLRGAPALSSRQWRHWGTLATFGLLVGSLLLCLSGTVSPTSSATRELGSIQVTATVVGSGEAVRATLAARSALASSVGPQNGTHALTDIFEADWTPGPDEWCTQDGLLRIAWAPGGPDRPEDPSSPSPIRVLVIEYVGN